MKKNIDLLEGRIAPALAKLAFPIMGTSLIQMAYNMTDMIWIGRMGSSAVAAVGAAGMYLWLANGLITAPKMGAQVKVGQALGRGEPQIAKEYAQSALQMSVVIGILYGILCLLGSTPLISFFRLNGIETITDARTYLMITGGGVLFTFMNQTMAGMLAAMGNSMAILKATTVGLLVNIILDPFLIFGIGIFPKWGVVGAAIATVLAQAMVSGILFIIVKDDPVIFRGLSIFDRPKFKRMKEMVIIGGPVAIQSMLFTGISMVLARLVASFSDVAVAVQKVGTQIESISWMTAEGFGTAVNAFTAQNYGAGKYDRIRKGYISAVGMMSLWGLFTSFMLIVFPEAIFRIFLTEAEAIPLGIDYLRILGVSQLFMCIEMTSAGVFQGLGRTVPASLLGIILTGLRIPAAMWLSSTVLELNGIWWSITISSVLKGLVLPAWLIIVLIKLKKSEGRLG